MKKKGQFFSLLLLIAVGCTLFMGYLLIENKNLKNELSSCERSAMFKQELTKLNFTNSYYGGVYKPSKYYCVWTEGRSDEEITKTELHEQCHWLVDPIRSGNQKEHFCGASS